MEREPGRSTTIMEGRRELKVELRREKKKTTSDVCNRDQPREFGTKTPNVRLF